MRLASILLAAILLPAAAALAHPPAAQGHPVHIAGDHFVRDGKPYQIISGSMHYERIPRADWRRRLRMARAMGLNTIETYVFWNASEPHPGVFDFSGRNDIAAFVRMAGQEGLNVILRPGPYVCAEWEAGGFPAWLFADPHLRVRTRDPAFMAAVDTYFQHLGKQLVPLLASHGGPIIAVQVENEYGSFGDDRAYMQAIRHALLRAGFGGALLFTADGPSMLHNDTLPGVLAAINFGPGQARKAFTTLAKVRPGQPRFNAEYWAGWFDQWGGTHAHTDAEQQARELGWMLRHGDSVNLYMFHGGTSFGFMNGANYQEAPSDHYAPQTTSYDYDAALDESGRPTAKYYLFRRAIAAATGTTPPPVPKMLSPMTLPRFTLGQSASLWDNLPTPVTVAQPQPMSHFGQAYGYILYRTRIHGPVDGRLYLGRVRDYAVVYVDHHRVGTADRRLKQRSVHLKAGPGTHELDVLVENTGRINYGPRLQDGRAGLIDPVWLAGHKLSGWQVYPLPMTSPDRIHGWTDKPVPGPAFHRGTFTAGHATDTYLDVSRLGKGFAWVDGHNLGRIWNIGPQRFLYLPGVWLHKGRNTMVEFDLTTQHHPTVRGVTKPIWSESAKK